MFKIKKENLKCNKNIIRQIKQKDLMRAETQVKALIVIIILLSSIYIYFLGFAILKTKQQANTVNELEDKINIRDIEIDSSKETIYIYERVEK